MHVRINTLDVALGLFALFLSGAFAAQTFPAYRVIQYDKAGSPFGSRRTILNLLASGPSAPDLSRKVALVRASDLQNVTFDDLLTNKHASGVVVLLPESVNSVPEATLGNWKRQEQDLLNMEVRVPVYFAKETSDLRDIYDSVVKLTVGGRTTGSSAKEGYQFVVSGSEASKISRVEAVNIVGTLYGDSGPSVEGEALPTIAIVAHYDTFGAAPELANGTDTNGSGAVALLELARLFSKLYALPRSKGRYNLLFVLSGAGRLNYAGSKQWLAGLDPRVAERLEYAICLDSIGRPGPLYMHVAKPLKEPEIQKLYDSFKEAGASLGVPVTLIHKKVNVSSSDVSWEHEHFSKKRLFAATISSRQGPAPSLSGASIFDQRDMVDPDVLLKNIQVIAEALATHIFGLQGKSAQVFDGSLKPSSGFVSSWLDALSRLPRVAPFMPRANPTISALEKVISDYIKDVSKQPFTVETDIVFYDRSRTIITAYRVKPITFHVALLLAVFAYLVVLYLGLLVFFKGPQSAWLTLMPASRTNKKRQSS
mmetsp:Transcript_19193/g.31416  ORF Transcript_19193/g.31416 Transcript_19193/m.31416 type:complete len:538 (+) Transcript_19193:93-1706(+)|eukprot:CAMPEP_0184351014 /NCGR_PEP_ID=MMETSP1089-20130417/43323_1 /TAXON_ID=38269 ORGANISM="Gloeochaete wittrockiana, Strain SAG46.84" /NCGR_SAMPLE_ID=MMETSP1089 /ASSEMBLY_ACC=CAM_ASM_000445 /LENGTH=537 /DNA_ID=CAMNT_0026684193 /DNA_START=82 /DNA_END=1695 /DNA_ORIENTATION=-